MSSQHDNIASINLPGILDYLPQNFSYLDAIKEVIDNSLDSNGKNIKVILRSDYIAISDDGDGMDESVRNRKFLDFFGRTFNSSKIGSKGIGAKAATAKLSNNQNMYYFTKTKKDAYPQQINVFHADAIKSNLLTSYSQTEIQKSKDKELMSRKDLVYNKNEINSCEHAFEHLGLSNGTIFYLNNRDSCKLVLESLNQEAIANNSKMYDYVMNDFSNTYSNFLQEGIKIELIDETVNTLIKPCKMFDLSKYKEYEIRYLEEKKECYIKIDNQWNKVLYSKSTIITQFEKAKDKDIDNPKLLKFKIYHWYENDLNSYSENIGYNKKFKSDGSNKEAEEINKMYDKVAGVYGFRNNKFTKRYWTIDSKKFTTGDYDKRPVYRGSIFVIKHDNTCDSIFETGINKSVLGTKKEANYFTNSMICIVNNIIALKISELKKNGILQDETDEEQKEEKKVEPPVTAKKEEKKVEPPVSAKKEEKKVEPLVTAKKEEKKIEPPVTAKKEEKKIEPPVTAKKEEKKVEPLVTAKKEEKKVETPVKDKVVVPLVKENENHKIVTEKLKAETLMCIFKKIKKPEDVDDNDWKKFEEEIQELITCKK